MAMLRRARTLAATFTIAAAGAVLSGCYDDTHLSNRDLITRQAGDAIAVNTAVQTIDPWPKEAKNKTLDVDGKRAEVAIKRYDKNNSVPPRGLNTTTVTGSQGPGPQQTTSIQN